jgi:hypothetical protein
LLHNRYLQSLSNEGRVGESARIGCDIDERAMLVAVRNEDFDTVTQLFNFKNHHQRPDVPGEREASKRACNHSCHCAQAAIMPGVVRSRSFARRV